MMNAMKLGLGVALALALVGSPGSASAAGLAVDASELPAATRAALAADIQRARAEVPELFRQVEDVAKRANDIDAASRAPGAPLTSWFKALGPRALMPMLDMLAFGGRAPSGLTPTAASALRVGLVEAVGVVRDARAVPVLARIVARERDVEMTRASADALGRIGTDEAMTALMGSLAATEAAGGAGANSERAHAILAGIGSSRRLDATRLLAKKLDASPDEATARAIAKALGTAGNAWAWKTLSARTDEAAVRETAARALVRVYVQYRGEARTAAGKALLVVDDASTPSLVAEAKRAAAGDTATALDELATRLAKNPTR